MITLERHIEAINFTNDLDQVKNLLDHSTVKTSFTAKKLITLEGCSGAVSIDFIGRKVLNAAHKSSALDNSSPEKMLLGQSLIKKVRKMYESADTLIKGSNCITKIINWIKNLFARFNPYTTDFWIEQSSHFLQFSEKRFIDTFGYDSGKRIDYHKDYKGSAGVKQERRIIAKKTSVENLLTLSNQGRAASTA